MAAAWRRTPFLSKVWVKAIYCLTMLRSWPCFVFWPLFLHFSSEMWASSQPKKIMQREANPCNSCGLTFGGFTARRISNKALSCRRLLTSWLRTGLQVEELSELQSPLRGTVRKEAGSNVPKLPESDLRTHHSQGRAIASVNSSQGPGTP